MVIGKRFIKTHLVRSTIILFCLFNSAVICAFGWLNSNMEYFFDPLRIMGERIIIGLSVPEHSSLKNILERDSRVRIILFDTPATLHKSMKIGNVLDGGLYEHNNEIDVYLPAVSDSRIPIVSSVLRHNLAVYEDFKRRQIIGKEYPQYSSLLFLSDISTPFHYYPGATGFFDVFFSIVIPLILILPGFVFAYIILEQLKEERRLGTYKLLLTTRNPAQILRQFLGATTICSVVVTAFTCLAIGFLIPTTQNTQLFVITSLTCLCISGFSLRSAIMLNNLNIGKTVAVTMLLLCVLPVCASMPAEILTRFCLGLPDTSFIPATLLMLTAGLTAFLAPLKTSSESI